MINEKSPTRHAMSCNIQLNKSTFGEIYFYPTKMKLKMKDRIKLKLTNYTFFAF